MADVDQRITSLEAELITLRPFVEQLKRQVTEVADYRALAERLAVALEEMTRPGICGGCGGSVDHFTHCDMVAGAGAALAAAREAGLLVRGE